MTRILRCDLFPTAEIDFNILLNFQVGFPRDGTSQENMGWDISLNLCPGTKIFLLPDVRLSRDVPALSQKKPKKPEKGRSKTGKGRSKTG
jgi:hypothetical protein